MLKRRYRYLFWGIVLACLLFGLNRDPENPAFETPTDLIISEFMAANNSGLADEDGDYVDWIELYNRGDRPVNLSGWSLTDDPGQPEKWPFPNITLHSDERLVIYASGKNRRPADPEATLHTNFKLKKSGDFLGLYRILDQKFVSQFQPYFPAQLLDISYGYYNHDDKTIYGYLETPTPGQPNIKSSAKEGITAPVQFSVKRGFYDSPFTVNLATTTPGSEIRFTLDGSEPSLENGQVYSEPIRIETTSFLRAAAFTPNLFPSPVETHSYIFLDAVLVQPKTIPGLPPIDYAMDPRIVNDPRYHDRLRHTLESLPTMSLVTNWQSMDIYQNPEERGVAWERAVSVEFMPPDPDEAGFQTNAGLRIQGGVGRLPIFPKHSFRLFFKGIYGPTKLTYPIFPDSPVAEFDTLVLRGGVNDSYVDAGYIASEKTLEELKLNTYTRDEWLRTSQIAMSGAGSHGIFVHLYLNGLYWGLYNVVERPDASFASAYLGGEREAWYSANQSGPVSGEGARFEEMLAFAKAHDLADPQNYEVMKTYLDMPQFIDYVILNLYSGNEDWGHNNWYVAMQNPNGKANYFTWDGERVWFGGAHLFFGRDKWRGERNRIKNLFHNLIKNEAFKMAFADRVYLHLFNDGALTEANSQERWRRVNAPVEHAILGELARWGDELFEPPLTQSVWQAAHDDVLQQMEGNVDRFIALVREAGYYPPIDPPTFNYDGGLVAPGFEVNLTTEEAGEIYYTTDGSDPRQAATGALAVSAQVHQAPITLETRTQIKARLRQDDTWSALTEAIFYVTDPTRQIQVTELMYNPPEGGDYEFIELKNNGSNQINLAGATFEGIQYSFPPNAPPVAPGEFVVLVRNSTAFAQKYPGVAIDGSYQGQLANSGERITLRDAEGQEITSVTYSDRNGWPVTPDGRGDSLVLAKPDGDPNSSLSWRASNQIGGSPGMDDPVLQEPLSLGRGD